MGPLCTCAARMASLDGHEVCPNGNAAGSLIVSTQWLYGKGKEDAHRCLLSDHINGSEAEEPVVGSHFSMEYCIISPRYKWRRDAADTRELEN